MAKTTSKLALPSNLSMIRALNPSVFSMFAIKENEAFAAVALETAEPVMIRRETVRGVQGGPKTPEAKRGVPNVQTVDIAALPHDKGTLMLAGSVLVTSDATSLHGTNSTEFAAAYGDFIDAFGKVQGFEQLAERYVMNLVNGRILFRNAIGMNQRCAIRGTEVVVIINEEDLDGNFPLSIYAVKDKAKRAELKKIIEEFAGALQGTTPSVQFQVRAAVDMGAQQEVYPSQVFPTKERQAEKEKGEGRELARALRNDDVPQAALHARKIGNALRTIDDWYPGAVRAVPVEPFAVEQSTAAVYRVDGNDFYSYLGKLPALTEGLRSGKVSDEALFTAAMCIRGGVFGAKEEGDDK